jgi:hypothetical protein
MSSPPAEYGDANDRGRNRVGGRGVIGFMTPERSVALTRRVTDTVIAAATVALATVVLHATSAFRAWLEARSS